MPKKLAIQAFQVRTARLSRQIRLTGEIEAVVEYSNVAGTIHVNGKRVVAKLETPSPFGWAYYQIRLPAPQGGVPARLDVRAPVLEVEKLVLWVGGWMVYADEEHGRVMTVGAIDPGSHTLPVPGSRPDLQTADLPVPAAEPGVERSDE